MRRFSLRLLAFAVLLTLGTGSAAFAQVQDTLGAPPPRWPVELETDSGALVIYSPQLERFANNQLTGRAAFSVSRLDSAGNATQPRFGTFWFTSRVDVDRDANLVIMRDLSITRVRFPNVTVEQQRSLEALVRARLEENEVSASLDRIVALVAAAETEQSTASDLGTEPPRIIVTPEKSVLVLYDGDPIYRPVPDTRYQRIVNTAMLVVKDTASGLHYLTGNNLWYSARSPMGPWDPADRVPDSLRTLVPDTLDFDVPDGPPPRIYTAKEPTELIVTDGPLSLQAVQGAAGVQAAVNTESDILKYDGVFYVLLSGRWYAATDMTGPWEHVRPDSLPRAFAQIVPNSVGGDVLAFVPGTPQADEAMADAMIPQTTAIQRSTATFTAGYDGEPDFDTIPGTNGRVSWAYNSDTPILRVGDRYYACSEAVWFVAAGPNGPWVVSDSVPQAVQSIPASSPVYNVKYVQVYESTPDVVYVGYTPGYVGAYPYYGTVVYGTGYVYPPYMGAVYYPRPVTYGFHAHYNPYTGWGVGVGVSVGFLTVGISTSAGYYPPGRMPPAHRPPPGGGRFGAAGYRPSTMPAGGRGNGAGRPSAGARPAGRPAGPGGSSIYNRAGNTGRNAARPSTRQAGQRSAGGFGGRPSAGNRAGAGGPTRAGAGARPNNVFSSPSGDVMRRQGNSWQQQGQRGGWQNQRGGSSAGGGMNRDYNARNRGSSREAGRSSMGGGRGGGGARGGGGGRRR